MSDDDDTEFQKQLEDLLPFLVFSDSGTVHPKTVAGTWILAGDVPAYLKSYVTLLNTNEKLSALNIGQVSFKIVHNPLNIFVLQICAYYRRWP